MSNIRIFTGDTSKKDDGGVIGLVTKPEQANQQTVEALENMLAMAKAGEIVQVAIAATCMEGYTHTAFSSQENIGLLIGATERLKFRLLNFQNED